MTLRVLVCTVGACTGLSKLACDLRVHEEALFAVSTFGEILAWLCGVDKFALTVKIAALWPERALYFDVAILFVHRHRV